MDYKIADLLKSPDITGLRLVAGAAGVENSISRTNIMDNPDTFDWLIAGELLLSTGYIFQDNEEMQRNIVQRLAEIRCSGLCIKVHRYLPEIPDCMIEEAEKLGLPLIELPFGLSLSMITEMINRHIFAKEENRMEQALVIHRELTRAALQSGGLREITAMAVGFVHNPILIFDSNWRLLSWEDYPGNPHPLEENLVIKRKAEALPQSFTKSMPEALEMFRKPVTRRLPLKNGQQVICRIMPVGAGNGSLYGYVVVWETVHTLDAADYLALEQVTVSIAMERSRAREIEEMKFRIKRDFFDDLLSGNIESLSAVRSLAELHGLQWESRYRCILVRHSAHTHEEKLMNQQKYDAQASQCAKICMKTARKEHFSVVAITRSFQTILLIEISKEADDLPIRDFADRLAEDLAATFPQEQLLLVVSAVAEDITHIAETFADVQQTLRLTNDLTPSSAVVYVEDYAVFHLLDKNIDRLHLDHFARQALGKLMDHDQTHCTQLVQTLNHYFAQGGNISEAAKRMYIHRNTYIYRMDKIKGILGDDLANPQKLLEYQIALLCMKIAGEK